MHTEKNAVPRRLLYVIYDTVAEEAGPIFDAKSDAVAVRACRQTLGQVSTISDYQLICVGYICPDTCQLEVCSPRVISFVLSPDGQYAVSQNKEVKNV